MASESPRYVVDASVAAKWQLDDEQHAEQALAVLQDFVEGEVSLVAPDLIRDEVANAILRAARNEQRQRPETLDIGKELFATFLELGLELVSTAHLRLYAYDLAAHWQCSYYDALYMALAESIECLFIHADGRLRRTLRGQFPRELWIEDYQPAGTV